MAGSFSLTQDKILTTRQWKLLSRELEDAKSSAEFLNKKTTHVHDYYLINLGWMTGLRISEVSRLNWGDIGDDEWLVVKDGKGSKDRTIFYGKKTQALIDDYRRYKIGVMGSGCKAIDPVFTNVHRKRYGPSGIHRRMKFWLDRVKLPDKLSYHSLRHGFATRMLNEGVGLHDLREMLGHSSIAVTSVYLHFTEDSREKFRKLL